MGVKNNKFSYIIFFLLILLIFKSWFTFLPLSSGDWSYNFEESIKAFDLSPYIWSFNLNAGLGGTSSLMLSLSSYFLFTASFLFNFLKIPWVLIERMVWFWPFLIISVSSSYYLFKKLFANNFALVSSLLFVFNTYILMIVGGGQMGVGMAYSIVPLVLCSFIKLNENIEFRYSLLFGILYGVLVMFDLRIAYITLFALVVYFLFNIKKLIISKDLRWVVKSISYLLIIPFTTVGFLHAFWILPLLVFHQNPVQSFGAIYTSADAVKFFSFARLENSLGLLHPNWPENIFGKVGFMRPEFLLLPIMAFSSLLFIKKEDIEKEKYVLFFAFIGLMGAFLAKGANEPFGGIYPWLFNHFPGFIMFRDPTKWYILVAISYSILIPFTVWRISDRLKSQSKSLISNFQNFFLIFAILYLLFLIRPAILGRLTGTFKPNSVPNDYIKLEQFLSSQNNFSRTIWIPTQQRFGFYANTHPAISAEDFLRTVDYSKIIKKMNTSETELSLKEAGVKYVIVPYDSQGEIFLKDRKYNEEIYKKTINEVKQISYLRQVSDFGRIAVFELRDSKDHFWSPSENLKIKYDFINPTRYRVQIQNSKKGDILVFSESFDTNWIAENLRFRTQSLRFRNKLNSFKLSQDGNYELEIYYAPQRYVEAGLRISLITFLALIGYLLFGEIKKKW